MADSYKSGSNGHPSAPGGNTKAGPKPDSLRNKTPTTPSHGSNGMKGGKY